MARPSLFPGSVLLSRHWLERDRGRSAADLFGVGGWQPGQLPRATAEVQDPRFPLSLARMQARPHLS